MNENDIHLNIEKVEDYYKEKITKRYVSLVHEVDDDDNGRGHAFPYDDSSACEAVNQSGSVKARKVAMR